MKKKLMTILIMGSLACNYNNYSYALTEEEKMNNLRNETLEPGENIYTDEEINKDLENVVNFGQSSSEERSKVFQWVSDTTCKNFMYTGAASAHASGNTFTAATMARSGDKNKTRMVINSKSSFAKKIAKDPSFKKEMNNHKKFGKSVFVEDSGSFPLSSLDLFGAIHAYSYTAVIDYHPSSKSYTYAAQIKDRYNFEWDYSKRYFNGIKVVNNFATSCQIANSISNYDIKISVKGSL